MLTLRESNWSELPSALARQHDRLALARVGNIVKMRLGLARAAIELREVAANTWHVRAMGFAGTLGIGGELVDVSPRFLTPDAEGEWRATLARMVAIHSGVPLSFLGEGRAARSKTSFFDHLAIAFAQRCRRAAQIGPILTYTPQAEIEDMLRGRLDVPQQSRLLLAGRAGIAQRTNALSVDNAHMALLRWGLEFLLVRVRSPAVRSQLDSLQSQLPPCAAPLNAAVVQTCAKPPFGAQQWAEALALARALYESSGAGQRGDEVALPGIVFHTARMFESVVRYATSAACGAARAEGVSWTLAPQKTEHWLKGDLSPLTRRVRPDAIIEEKSVARLIVDAKNKDVRLTDGTVEPNPAREDLHEVLTYMVHFDCASACLLYPWSAESEEIVGAPLTLTTTTAAAQKRRVLAALLNVRVAVHLPPRVWARSLYEELRVPTMAVNQQP